MFHLKRVEALNPQRNNPEMHKQKFDALCAWIEAHLSESIGWQELMNHSGLEYQTIQALFFRFTNTTAMTWIRRRREALPSVATESCSTHG